MPAYTVMIADYIEDELAPEREILADVATVVAVKAKSNAEAMPQLCNADAVIAYHTLHFDPTLLNTMARCKLLVRGGVGTDNVDLKHARSMGLAVANVPDYGTEEVADSAFAHILALTRGIHLYNRVIETKTGPWNHKPAAPLTRLRGKTLGIVGAGRIGLAVALRGKAFGMNVAYYDPYAPAGTDKALGIRQVETLDELLKLSFVLTCHCPLTPETLGMIDEKAIAKMPRGSYLVNTGRGAVVKNECLPDFIRSGQLAGAGIDVFEHEPPADDHPLVKAWRDVTDPCHNRVIITPHAAFYSEEGLLEIRTKSARNCRRALLGEKLLNVVN